MKSSRFFTCALAVCLIGGVSIVGQARATLISTNDVAFGADSITLDTATGLEWLDLSHTVARSFSDVSSKFGIGQEFEGFRHATRSDIETFFDNAGLGVQFGDPNNNFKSPENLDFQPFEDLLDLVGTITTGGDPGLGTTLLRSHATTSTLIDGERFSPIVRRFHIQTGPTTFGDKSGSISATTIPDSSVGGSDVAHWLVRETAVSVPAPLALPLFLIGVASIAIFRRSARRNIQRLPGTCYTT